MNLIKPMTQDLEEYLRDESRNIGYADSISFPKTEDELIAILREMNQNNVRVTVQGGRTGLAAGAVPRGGHVLNLSRMDRVLGCSLDAEGVFHLRVQPGVILSQLHKMLQDRRIDTSGWDEPSKAAYYQLCTADEQFFPPDPTETSATIGGMVSCNASGARSFHYKATRRHIQGLRVVLMDGRVLALRRGREKLSGRHLRLTAEDGTPVEADAPSYRMPDTKNASGYYVADNMDAIDLFIGSDGTLGVVSEIEILLRPVPKYIWGISCMLPGESDAIAFVENVRYMAEEVVAAEYFDRNALGILRRQKEDNPAFAQLPEIPADTGAIVYIELHCGDEETAERNLFAIGERLPEYHGSEANTWVARNEADLVRLQFFRHAIPESVNMLIDQRKKTFPAITKLGTDMSVPDGCLRRVVEVYREGISRMGLESATWGHIGNNHLHVNILPRDEEDYHKGKTLIQEWSRVVSAMGGAVSAEHGVGKIKAGFLRIMYGEEAMAEMRTLKQSLDPRQLLGYGTLFGEVAE